jgi:SAM-dependent methyltransferase
MSHPAHEGVVETKDPSAIPDMPGFAIVVVKDYHESIRWYTEGLGFWVEKELTGPDGLPAVIHLRRAQYRDLLLRPARDELPEPRGKGVRLTFSCPEESEESLEKLAERARALQSGSVQGPMRTPWRTIDLVSQDPDGYEVVISTYETANDWAELQHSVRTKEAYDTAYRTGAASWAGAPHPELEELIEGPSALPPGRAVDLGCGTGEVALYLASHGWDVTAVDNSPEAIKKAKEAAAEADVDAELIAGDVRRIDQMELAGRFDLLIDIGCCHSLGKEERRAYADGLARIAASEATLFMFAFTRGWWTVTEADVGKYFSHSWKLLDTIPGRAGKMPDAGPMWYRLTPRNDSAP